MNCSKAIVILLLLTHCGRIDIDTTTNQSPQQLFERLIRKPLPQNINSLQGSGWVFQGYDIYLRFKTDRAVIQELVRNYKEIDCKNVSLSRLITIRNHPKVERAFDPPWNPLSESMISCYQLQKVRNSWTHDGVHYFLINYLTAEVYFIGVGA